MKKIIITIILGLLISSSVMATIRSFTTKQEAIDAFNIYKTNRETNIAKVTNNITYTTDKICEIQYQSEDIICYIRYDITLNGLTENHTIILDNETTLAEDQAVILAKANKQIRDLIPIENHEYTERVMKDNILQLTK